MILLIAAAVAAAAPAPAACPDVVTSEAFVCRALVASKSGQPEAAAQAFERKARDVTLRRAPRLPRFGRECMRVHHLVSRGQHAVLAMPFVRRGRALQPALAEMLAQAGVSPGPQVEQLPALLAGRRRVEQGEVDVLHLLADEPQRERGREVLLPEGADR